MCFLHEYRNTKMSSMYKFHIFIVVINVLLQHCATLIDGAQVNYDKFQAWTLVPRTKQQLTFLENLADLEEDGGQIQFWDPPTSIGNPVRLIIGPEKINKIQNHAKRLKLPIDHQITNLKDQLVQEKIPRKHYDYKSHVPDFSLDEYHRYDDIQDYLRGLEKEYANFVQVDSIGLTPDGRSIDAIKIGDFSANSSKPTLWIDAGIHAREWIAPATALYIIDQIVSTYATSNDSDVLQVNWMVLPVVNPDGYEYSHTNDRLWRKNRGKCRTQKKNKRCCYGVDLNRNWNFHWKTSGVSTRPCASNYPGEAAFSEPETKAMSDYILEHKDDIKMLLTLHSYGQYWMYPYGHKKKTYSTNVKMHQEIAATAVGAIRKNSGQRYRTGSAADALYPASGCSDDWAKSIGIDIVYTVELPPRNSFVLSPTKIGPTGDDMWKAILTMVEYIQPDNKYLNDTPTDPELGVRCENYSRKCARYSKSYCDRVSVRKRCPLHCNVC